MKKLRAKAYADELDAVYGNDAINEGIARVRETCEVRATAEAQSWLSAVFILARRLRGEEAPAPGRHLVEPSGSDTSAP